MSEYPKTFKELFEGTGIEPTTDADGSVHYNFKAVKKDDKYFTPSIEDIRIGDIVEIGYPQREETFEEALESLKPESLEKAKIWKTIKCDVDQIQFIDFMINADAVRVPYLTKEQIEAEGWEVYQHNLYWKGAIPHGSGVISLSYNYPKPYELFLYQAPNTLYRGECKDINTFRYICKLLNIN